MNLCRKKHVKPEDALEYANSKFIRRFNILNSLAKEKNLELENLTAEQWDELWNKAKYLAK